MGTSISDLEYALMSVLGFERDSSGDHVRFILKVKGRVVARTMYSHSWRKNEQISEQILPLQARQLGCTMKTLKGLLQKRLGKEEYFREILSSGKITQEEFELLCGERKKDK